jgi:hypothetical protein
MRWPTFEHVYVQRCTYKRRARLQAGAGSGVGKRTASIERTSQAHSER